MSNDFSWWLRSRMIYKHEKLTPPMLDPDEETRMLHEKLQSEWERWREESAQASMENSLKPVLEKGFKKGLEQGINIGRDGERTRVIQNLLRQEFTVDEIAQLINVTRENVETVWIAMPRRKLQSEWERWRDEGIEKGREEGREEGRKEGREEAAEEALIRTARDMLDADVNIDLIAKFTRLSLEKIREIEAEMRKQKQ